MLARSRKGGYGATPHPTTAGLGRSYRSESVRYWRVDGSDCATRPKARLPLRKTR